MKLFLLLFLSASSAFASGGARFNPDDFVGTFAGVDVEHSGRCEVTISKPDDSHLPPNEQPGTPYAVKVLRFSPARRLDVLDRATTAKAFEKAITAGSADYRKSFTSVLNPFQDEWIRYRFDLNAHELREIEYTRATFGITLYMFCRNLKRISTESLTE